MNSMEKTFKIDIKKRVIRIMLSIAPFTVIFISRSIHYNDNNYYDAKKMLISMLITMIFLLIIITFVGVKTIVVSDLCIQEQSLLRKKKFDYNEMDKCIYDEKQQKLIVLINGNTKTINISNFDSECVVKELEQYILVELL